MTELDVGSAIGNYRVVRLLGQGGMAAVYEVEHIGLGTHYALKTFIFDADDEAAPALKAKFLEEGKLLARLKHPNLTHVFDLGFEEKTQMPYFVMDLVVYEDGESYTAEDIDLKDIDEELVRKWFAQLASALDYIHGEGIVHRDIKPGNLLVDKDLRVILTDFGISRIFGSRIRHEVNAARTMVTRTGRGKLVLGTEHYIAPEVAEGEEATPQADAYSLGVMLLRWLTGFYYADNPGALALLSGKKYRWLSVISRLLAPAGRRPERYSELVAQLKPNAAARQAAAKSPAASRAQRRSWAQAALAACFVLAFVCGAAWFGYVGWQRYEDRERAKAAQLAAMQEQLNSQAGVTNTVHIVEQSVVTVVKTNVQTRLVSLQTPPTKRRDFGEGYEITEAVYGLYAEGEPVPDFCADIADNLCEKVRQGENKIRITNRLAGWDPAPKKPKLVRIRYVWKGKAETVTLREGEEFVLPQEDVARLCPKAKTIELTPATTPEMVIVKDEVVGPIPDMTYQWFLGTGNEKPLRVDFTMANGAKIELLPIKKGVFYMSNSGDDKKARHKVTLTRPFWVSKFCVTTAQWREFDAKFVADCLPIEKALQGKYPLSRSVRRSRFDAFCAYLTAKYRKQLPAGYVFRLPSEAEWEYALDVEGTWLKFARQGKDWQESLNFDRALARKTLEDVVSKCGLESLFLSKDKNWNRWGWSVNPGKNDSRTFIGGRLPPHVNGICDAQQPRCYLLDKVKDWKTKIPCRDEEVDPLYWEMGPARSVVRSWEWGRAYWGDYLQGIQHVVLGPDLIAEKAWQNPRKDVEDAVTVPNRQYAWNPARVPKVIKKPKELTFKMVEGGDMVFCTIPAGTFNMTNPEGQDKSHHKVTLTKPFWITKYCVTTKQWREYGKYDCEGFIREVEKNFPKHPVYQVFSRYQWDGFCAFLNKRYGHQLPKGYVFRLPTEAEWEWAFIGDKNGDLRKMSGDRFLNSSMRFQDEFEKLLKKKKLEHLLPFDRLGNCGVHPFCVNVGGRTDCTDTFGVCDMVVHGAIDGWMYDTFDCEKDESRAYEDSEVDPVHWAGRLASRGVISSGLRRTLWPKGASRAAHLVVGPNIETPSQKKELEPYPENDFGGTLLSGSITHGGLSSQMDDWRNSPERFKRMLSTENTLVAVMDEGQDLRGFHTQREASPWIQLNLDGRYTITGFQIDALGDRTLANHIRVWISEDARVWREVAADNVQRHRYRFDLQRKSVTAKYIRIGREPGFTTTWFALDKILVYGTK